MQWEKTEYPQKNLLDHRRETTNLTDVWRVGPVWESITGNFGERRVADCSHLCANNASDFHPQTLLNTTKLWKWKKLHFKVIPFILLSKKQSIYKLPLCLVSVICHLSMVFFAINSKNFAKILPVFKIDLFLFSPVFLRSLRNSFISGYRDSSQSSIFLIITSTVLDFITLLLWLS